MLNNPHEISAQELKKLLDDQEAIQLVDVRTKEKHDAFNIGGVLIPIDEFVARQHELQQLAKDKLIVTYCTSGNRSMRALEALLSLGFTNVKSLAGGMTAWQAFIK